MAFRLVPEAEDDLTSIVLHIADESPAAARRWYAAILDRCNRLGDMPGMGTARPEVLEGLRVFPVGNYLILYREAEGGADILRVLHSARQWQELL